MGSNKFKLCSDIHEYPVYKIMHHMSPTETKVFVFIGKSPKLSKLLNKKTLNEDDIQKLHETYGKNFRKKLAIGVHDVVYVNDVIYHDDTIITVLGKLAACFSKHYSKPLTADQFYAWIDLEANNSQMVLSYFLDHLFHERTIIKYEDLNNVFSYYTGNRIQNKTLMPDALLNKVECFNVLRKQKFLSVKEPLLFKFVSNGSFCYFPIDPFSTSSEYDVGDVLKNDLVYEHARLIESFSIQHNILHVVTHDTIAKLDNNLVPMYFPLLQKIKSLDANVLNNNDDVLARVATTDVSNMTCICNLNYVHLRVNENASFTTDSIDLYDVFANFEPSNTIPFVKYVSSVKSHYKAYKPTLSYDITESSNDNASKITKDHLQDWTKTDLIKYMKKSYEIVVFKVFLGNVNNNYKYATVILHGNYMYDVKYNFKISDKVSAENFKKYADQVNVALSIIKKGVAFKTLLPFIDKSFWIQKPDRTDTQISKLMISGIITSTSKAVSVLKLEQTIKSMPQIFSVVSVKSGILHLLYKRIDNFTKQDNIMQYISRNFSLGKDEIVSKLTDVFSLSTDVANDYWKKWLINNKINMMKLGSKVYYKPNMTKFVSVKVKPSGVGYKFIVDGVTSALHQKRIVRALKVGILFAETGKTFSNAIGNDAGAGVDEIVVDNTLDQDIIDDLELDLDNLLEESVDIPIGDEIDDSFDNFLDDLQGNALGELTEQALSMLEMKEKMECPAAAVKPLIKSGGAPKKAPPEDDKKKHMFILNQLYDADMKLFFFKSKDNYAKSCQDVSKRQPVVMNKKELDYVYKCFPGALQNHVNTGSTPELADKNFFGCPVVWCPKSRVAMSKSQFENIYGSKCPFEGIDEEPMIFESSFFTGDKRYVGFLDPSKHPDTTESKPMYLPCCFNRPDTDEKGNEKYIKAYTFPLSKNRYGLLPNNLSSLFGNKFCGGKTGTTGLMNAKTDCYLRCGVSLSKHSYLMCLAGLLDNPNLKNENDCIKAIIKNLSMATFVLLDEGLLCKKFINDSYDIHDSKTFALFKVWFEKQEDYIISFNLQNVKQELTLTSSYHENLFYKSEIKREFLLYSAYTSFIKYLSDDNIPKTHDLLNTLFSQQLPWLNKNGFNIIIFETDAQNNAYMSCPYSANIKELFRKEKPCVLLIKSARFYEPVFHVSMAKGSLVQTVRHMYKDSAGVYRVIKYYLNACKKPRDTFASDIYDAIESTGQKVTVQVINYDFNLVGFYTTKKIFVPLKSPSSYLGNKVASFSFIDTFLKIAKFEVNENEVIDTFKKINSILGSEYFITEGSNDGNKILLKDNLSVPLKTLYDKKSGYNNVYNDDAAIFNSYNVDDDRARSMKEAIHNDNVYIAYRNEIVHLINIQKELYDDVMFLRHPANPLRLNTRRRILIDKLKPYMRRFLSEISVNSYNKLSSNTYQDRLCSSIGNKKDCNKQCIWLDNIKDGKRVGSSCKLGIKHGESGLLMERCVDQILNPSFPIKLVQINKRSLGNEDVLFFTDDDVERGKLNKVLSYLENPKIYDFEEVIETVDKSKLSAIDKKIAIKFGKTGAVTAKDDAFDLIIDQSTYEKVALPHEWRKQLKDFTITRTAEYNKNFLYEFFSKVNNRINPQSKLTSDQLYKLVKEKVNSSLLESFDNIKMNVMYNLYISTKVKKPDTVTASDITALINSNDYIPSEYEIRILSEIVKVNVIVISRKITRHDNIRCLGKQQSDFYVFLHQPTDSKRKYDVFEPIYKNDNKFIFELEEFNELSDLVKKKCTHYKIVV